MSTKRRNIMDMNFDIIPGHWHSCLGRLTTGVLTAVAGWPKAVSALVQTFAFTSSLCLHENVVTIIVNALQK